MALWLVRAGEEGEFEERFFGDNRVYLTWPEVEEDLGALSERRDILRVLVQTYPGAPIEHEKNHARQLWAFSHRMELGDWVVVPRVIRRAFNIAEIIGEYTYDVRVKDPSPHYRDVKWIATDIPRSTFDRDVLKCLGAPMTVYGVRRKEVEQRVREIVTKGGKTASAS
jgi:restriction system protein